MKIIPSFFSVLFLFNALVVNAQTTVSKSNNDWSIFIDGAPFEIKGVTFGHVDDIENYDTYFEDLKYLGVNTIRIWATGKNTKALLDAAHKYNMKVMVGIWMRHGRPGMEDDDSFNYLEDEEGKEAMYNNAIQAVEAFKDHPAVLTWALGNEVYLNTATDEEKQAYSLLLERIASNIKAIDPNHPITSVEAWIFGVDWWNNYVPSIDIYGLNAYGAGANFLNSELEKKGVDKPYIITEFGVTGEWDIEANQFGIKVEPSDQEKYDAIAKGYSEWIQPKPNCLGVYVFHYADDHRFIAPWLLTHHRSKKRPQYWAIRKAYTDKDPENNVPVVASFELTKEELESGSWIPVDLKVSDSENEELDISFWYNQRTGSRKRRDQINPLVSRGNLETGFEIQLPKEQGPIKVYVNVEDSYGNVGIASTAIKVTDEDAKNRKFLVPKAELPFIVYEDGDQDLPYLPTNYMGNYKAMTIDPNYKDDVHSGTSSMRIPYQSED